MSMLWMKMVSKRQSFGAKLSVRLCGGLFGGLTIGTGLSWCSAKEVRGARWLNRLVVAGRSRVDDDGSWGFERRAASLPEAAGFKALLWFR
jgi:hypothetical protein